MEETIQKLTEKFTSYNIFNNLLPGIIFCFLTERVTSFSIVTNNLLENFFIYYFVGMILSRIGSLFIKKFLEKLKVLKSTSTTSPSTSYEDYIAASENDAFIKILNETNNTYRTFIALFFTIITLVLFDLLLLDELSALINIYLGLNSNIVLFLVLCFFLIFLFTLSYKKQSQFIESRITHHIKTKNNS